MSNEIIKTRTNEEIEIFKWDAKNAKAVLVIAHGASEHIERYDDFAKYLIDNGVSVVGYNHHGHGPNRKQDSVYFADKDGDSLLVNTLEDVILHTYQHNSQLPIFLLGHSMGSLISRALCIQTKLMLDGVIISGSLHPSKKTINSGYAVAVSFAKLQGKKKTNKILNNLVLGKLEDVLSYNEKNVKDYIADPNCGMLFTNQAIVDLLRIIKQVVNPFEVGKMIRTRYFIIAGENDSFSDGTNQLYDFMHLLNHHQFNYNYKFYQDMKHEILNEKENAVVYKDILDFIKKGLLEK